MKRFFKHIGLALLLGVCIGITLAIIEFVFKIDHVKLKKVYTIVGVAVIFIIIIFYSLYIIYYNKKFIALQPLLNRESANEYISKTQELLKTAKGSLLKNTLKLNLSAGYLYNGDFENAISILEQIPKDEISYGTMRLVYAINIMLSYFYSNQKEKSKKVYTENNKLFKRYKENKIYAGNVAVIEIINAIIDEKLEYAKELLDQAKTKNYNFRIQESLLEIEKEFLNI